MGRREAIQAALKVVERVVADLAGSDVEGLLAFAGEDSEERRAVGEVAARMRIEASELADLALPKSLWGLADRLGEAAGELAEQAGRVGEASGEGVLDALAELDLSQVRAALDAADSEMGSLSARYGVTDAAVYGGGLYI